MTALSEKGPSARPVALTVAGSDSSGGAGIQADLRTFDAFGVYGTSAVTAVTAQGPRGLSASFVLPSDLVAAQLEAVSLLRPAAAKTGMLGSAEVVQAVAGGLRSCGIGALVVDPVLSTGRGQRLAREGTLEALKEVLLPMALVVTPNLPEAGVITGSPVVSRRDMEAAAERIGCLGSTWVVVKGGHLEGGLCPDLVWHEGEETWLEGARVVGRETHGTGCAFSAALCACIAKGIGVVEACESAKRFVAAILTASRLGG